MPRLFRKFDPNKSTVLQSKRNERSFGLSKSLSKFDNGRVYQSGEGYGSQRTYLCINPLRSMSKNKDFATQMRSLAHDETERALFMMEDSYQSTGPKSLIRSAIKPGPPNIDYKKVNLNEVSIHGDSKLSSDKIGATDLQS